MMLARLRGAAIGGLAVLLLSGAGVAFAGNATPTPAPALVTQPVVAAAPAAPVSTAGSQQVDVQQGDQTAPDTAGTAPTEQAGAEAPESASEAAGSATEAAGTETDGPGGHADATGSNVDYQFQGEQ